MKKIIFMMICMVVGLAFMSCNFNPDDESYDDSTVTSVSTSSSSSTETNGNESVGGGGENNNSNNNSNNNNSGTNVSGNDVTLIPEKNAWKATVTDTTLKDYSICVNDKKINKFYSNTDVKSNDYIKFFNVDDDATATGVEFQVAITDDKTLKVMNCSFDTRKYNITSVTLNTTTKTITINCTKKIR